MLTNGKFERLDTQGQPRSNHSSSVPTLKPLGGVSILFCSRPSQFSLSIHRSAHRMVLSTTTNTSVPFLASMRFGPSHSSFFLVPFVDFFDLSFGSSLDSFLFSVEKRLNPGDGLDSQGGVWLIILGIMKVSSYSTTFLLSIWKVNRSNETSRYEAASGS